MAGDDAEELREYREQLTQVAEALRHDPTNAELLATRQTLEEIIALSETLDAEPSSTTTSTSTGSEAPDAKDKDTHNKEEKEEEEEDDGRPAAKRVCAGAECEALHPCGTWYHAVVKAVLDDGTLIVDYGGLEPPVQVRVEDVRAVGAAGTPAARLGADTGSSHAHPRGSSNSSNGSSSKGGDEHVPTEVPQHLRIKATDSAEVRQKKQKRIRAIKSKMRFARKDEEGAAKRAQWLAFAQKSGVARHQSIFSTPASAAGRVGVAGSGHSMTPVAGTREAFSRAAMPPPPQQ